MPAQPSIDIVRAAKSAEQARPHNLGVAFSRIAAANGQRTALVVGDGASVSYATLDRLANRVAHALRRREIGRGDVVAIVHNKSTVCYAAMIACLKLGAAYVNLDATNPAARLRSILTSCGARLVLSDGPDIDMRATLATGAVATLDVSDVAGRADLSDGEPGGVADVTGSDPAYIMFTSGSTGVPKGALIAHGSVLNFAAWIAGRFAVTPDDVFSNVNPMYFDNSVFDFYGALFNGAALVAVSRESASNPPAMLRALESAGCTIWFSVPSLLIYLSSLRLLSADRLTTVRSFVFGGEGYPKPELRKLFAVYGHTAQLVNVYGPTECTCICSAWDVGADDLLDPDGFVTLGPIAENFSFEILDERGEPVEPGAVGELYLLGPQVALGYVNDPERTERSFVRNLRNAAWAERAYRTGDLVRRGADGRSLDFVGRKDRQIKHMGYRIELEEIESALDRIAGVVHSAVVQARDASGFATLCAYVASDRELIEREMRAEIAATLPAYMIPQRLVVCAELPKNANGKIDRVRLGEMANDALRS